MVDGTAICGVADCLWEGIDPASAADQTLRDCWTDWLATAVPRRLALATIRAYRRQLRVFMEWLHTTLDVLLTADSITPYCLNQYLARLESQVRSP